MSERRERILSQLGDVDPQTEKLVAPLVSELVWLESQLSATRALIGKAPVVVRYDNGGGQTGVRRNPAFDGYHALFKSYTAGLRALRELTGRRVSPDAERPGRLADMRQGSPLFKAM